MGGWILGTTAGLNTLQATAAGVSTPASITATVVNVPTQIVVVRGDGQTRRVGWQLDSLVVFAIQDAQGNGVLGQTINITPDGNGSVDNASPTSDANGEVAVQWTLATTPSGTQNLTAVVAGAVTPGVATATAIPAIESMLILIGGDNQTAVAGTPVAMPVSVKITDAFGNPIPDHTVTFTPSGDGQVPGGSPGTAVAVLSDINGIATTDWTLATTPGANTLVASHGHLMTAVTINATGT